MDENGNIAAMNPTATANAAEANEASAEALNSTEMEKLVERIVEKRLKQLRQEAEARATQARSEGRAEAERLANMSEDERRRWQAETNQAREEALTKREEELKRRELRAWVTDELAQRNLPRELAEFVNCEDAQSSAESVDKLEKVFREAVQRSVDQRIHRGYRLPRPNGTENTSMTQRMRAAAGLADC